MCLESTYMFLQHHLGAQPRPLEISSLTTINSKINRASLSKSLRRRNFCIAHWHRSTVRRLRALRSLLRSLLRRLLHGCLHWGRRGRHGRHGRRGRRGRRGCRGIWCQQFGFVRPGLEHRDPEMLLALQDVSCCVGQKWNGTIVSPLPPTMPYALCPTILQR